MMCSIQFYIRMVKRKFFQQAGHGHSLLGHQNIDYNSNILELHIWITYRVFHRFRQAKSA
jgi:hypothetical protein